MPKSKPSKEPSFEGPRGRHVPKARLRASANSGAARPAFGADSPDGQGTEGPGESGPDGQGTAGPGESSPDGQATTGPGYAGGNRRSGGTQRWFGYLPDQVDTLDHAVFSKREEKALNSFVKKLARAAEERKDRVAKNKLRAEDEWPFDSVRLQKAYDLCKILESEVRAKSAAKKAAKAVKQAISAHAAAVKESAAKKATATQGAAAAVEAATKKIAEKEADAEEATAREVAASKAAAEQCKKDFETLQEQKRNDHARRPPGYFNLGDTHYLSAVEFQDGVASCSAQAVVGLAEYLIKAGTYEPAELSRLFLYKSTRDLMGVVGDTGAYIRSTIQAMARFGVPSEDRWPYNPALFDSEPPMISYLVAPKFKDVTYKRIDSYGFSPEGVLVLLLHVLSAGFPVAFGFSVYRSIVEAETSPYIIPVPRPSPMDKHVGGHAVLAVGYNMEIPYKYWDEDGTIVEDHGALIIKNSWGENWADGGFAYLPFHYVIAGIALDFWTIFNQSWIAMEPFTDPEDEVQEDKDGKDEEERITKIIEKVLAKSGGKLSSTKKAPRRTRRD